MTEGEHAACWNATLKAVTNDSVSDCKDILSRVLQDFVFTRSLSNVLISALVGWLTNSLTIQLILFVEKIWRGHRLSEDKISGQK